MTSADVRRCATLLVAVALWTPALLPAQNPPAPQTTAGASFALVGQVRWPDRRVAPGVQVEARWRARAELPGLVGWSYADAVGHGEVRTDANGRFRIELPIDTACELAAITADGAHASPMRFPVQPGQFVELTLGDAWAIGGVVRNTAGEPQSDLPLRFEPHQTTWARYAVYGRPVQRLAVRTDADGRFRMPWLLGYLQVPQLEPFLVIEPLDSALQVRGLPMLRPTASSDQLQLVVEATPLLTGCIVDANGEPIAGAAVFPQHAPWRRVLSNHDGTFSLRTSVMPGILASAAGQTRGGSPVQMSGPLQMTLPLATAARVRMRLVADHNSNNDNDNVATADGNRHPLANCHVLWSTATQNGPPREWFDRTDPQGVIVCTAVGPIEPTFGFVSVSGVMRRFAVLRSAVATDTDLGDVTIVQRTLRGIAIAADGEPLVGARVVVRPVDEEPLGEHANLWVTHTDHGGGFRFAALPGGALRVMLEASAHGFAATVVDADAKPDRLLRLQPTAEGVVEIDTADEHGDAVPGAWVMLYCLGEHDHLAPAPRTDSAAICAFADVRGHARFTGLPQARWRVQVQSLRGGRMHAGTLECATGDIATTVRMLPVPL